jgi:radical SAM protein with 4Fe4S-binding SPASM domain
MQCLYCHAGEKNTLPLIRNELSHEQWLEVIKECRALGVKNFILTGGEPFLYLRWPELVEACGSDVRVVFSTNGKHFTDANFDILEGFPQVKEFRTSIDGMATNDVIREGSSYLASLENLRRLKQRFPDRKVMIQTVIYQQNLPEIPLLYQALRDIGIYCWRLSQLWKTVRTERNRDILDFSDYEKMFAFFAEVIQLHQRDGKPFLLRIDNVYYSWIEKEDYAPMDLCGHPCTYNFNFLCVNANGDLIFCPALNVPFASVKNQSIKDAIEGSKWLEKFKTITVQSLGCGNCRYIKICGGGCRADALRWLGKTTMIDPNSCCMMPRIEMQILPLLGDGERKAFEALINHDEPFPLISGRNIEEAVKSFLERR